LAKPARSDQVTATRRSSATRRADEPSTTSAAKPPTVRSRVRVCRARFLLVFAALALTVGYAGHPTHIGAERFAGADDVRHRMLQHSRSAEPCHHVIVRWPCSGTSRCRRVVRTTWPDRDAAPCCAVPLVQSWCRNEACRWTMFSSGGRPNPRRPAGLGAPDASGLRQDGMAERHG
jgi:hypothetical protein